MKNNHKLYDYKRKKKKTFKIHFDKKKIPYIARWIFKITVTCLLALAFVLNFGQRISAVGNSMSPVLENGDIVLVNKLIYNASAPKRGDIIAFVPKGNHNTHYYIKRIVGLPGETLQVIENKLYINGEQQKEDYEVTKFGDLGILGEEVVLKDDEYFVLSDSRGNNDDSRNVDIGNVKREYIYGKPWFIVSPGNHVGFLRSK